MQVSIGANVSINCIVAVDESPTPVIYITTPTGKVINASEISFTATLNNTGTYYCLGITHNILLKAKHHLLVVNGKYIATYFYLCMTRECQGNAF